jgi:voltage-gated sodium channel type II alpha
VATGGEGINLGFNPILLRVLRIFRIARLLRLVRSAKGLRTLLYTISESLPALLNVFGLLSLLCIIYAVLGMSLFGYVVEQPRLGLGGYTTFEDFGGAMLLVLQMATSEGWTAVMRACMVAEPLCGARAGVQFDVGGEVKDDCGPGYGVVAVLYFVSYQLFGALVMMNLMLGIVVNSFSTTSTKEYMLVSETVMLEFQEEWRKLDPASTYFISCHYLPTLIRALLPPLGFESGADTPNAQVNARIRRAWLPVRDGRVQFQEVLFALSRLQAGQPLPDCELRQYLDKQARKNLELKEFKGAPVDWTAHEFVAAELMQASFRGFCAREALHRARQRRIKGVRKEAAFLLSSRLLTDFITEESETASTAVKAAATEAATEAAAHTQVDQVNLADPQTIAAAVLIQYGWRWFQEERLTRFAMVLIKLSMRKWARRWIAKHRAPLVAPPDAEAEAEAATAVAGGGEAGRGGLLLLQEVSNWASQLFSPDAGAPAAAAAAPASPESRGRSIAVLDH